MNDLRKIETVNNYILQNKLDVEVIEQVEIEIKYQDYIRREKENADKLNRLEGLKIPRNFDFSNISSMSMEARVKLKEIQPVTVSQASRDRKSTRLNSSHVAISYAVFCLKKKKSNIK